MNKGSDVIDLELPVDDEKIKELKVGDIIYLTGPLMTARDHAHKRIIEMFNKGKTLPTQLINLKKTAIYHCGPIILQEEGNDTKFQLYSGGPTTSARMEKFQDEVCEILDIKIVIGKGGMINSDFKRIGGVYLSFTGGCGAIFAKYVKKIEGVIWDDLGMPEAIWIFSVDKFGPLIVAQDAAGENLYLS